MAATHRTRVRLPASGPPTIPFFFHYNKPLTQRTGKVVMTLHYNGACHYVNYLVCRCRTYSRTRKHSPRFVMAGRAREIIIRAGTALIVGDK